MKKLTYIIQINCGCFQNIKVEADNENEAIELAKNKFTCAGDSPELGEVII